MAWSDGIPQAARHPRLSATWLLHAGASGRYECNRDGEPWGSQQRKDVTELRKQVGELGK